MIVPAGGPVQRTLPSGYGYQGEKNKRTRRVRLLVFRLEPGLLLFGRLGCFSFGCSFGVRHRCLGGGQTGHRNAER